MRQKDPEDPSTDRPLQIDTNVTEDPNICDHNETSTNTDSDASQNTIHGLLQNENEQGNTCSRVAFDEGDFPHYSSHLFIHFSFYQKKKLFRNIRND